MIDYDDKITAVLSEYHDRMEKEQVIMKALPREEGMKRRDEFLLSVGKEAAVFLNTLAKSAQSKTVLEVGTSYGYSTIWLAEAARKNQGQVITLENDSQKANYAHRKVKEAGLAEFVEFRVDDARESIEKAPETFDFVLLDVWKELYVPCFDLFYPKLAEGAWILADNMIFPPHSKAETGAYRDRVRETGAFDTVLLPIGQGIEVSYFKS